MPILYSGPIHVEYHLASLHAPNLDPVELGDHFKGQHNGLCGAAVADHLQFVTGLHTGAVGVEVHLHDHEPDIDLSWQEIVEVNFCSTADKLWLMGLMGNDGHCLPIPAGEWRVRFQARNMQAGHKQDTSDEEQTIVDTYCIHLWPGRADECGIVKQTSKIAAYWHKTYAPGAVPRAAPTRATKPRVRKASPPAPAAPESLRDAAYVGRLGARDILIKASGLHLLALRIPGHEPVLLGVSPDAGLLKIPTDVGVHESNLQDGRFCFARFKIGDQPRLHVWDLNGSDRTLESDPVRPRVDRGELRMSWPWISWRTGLSRYRLVLHKFDTGRMFISDELEPVSDSKLMVMLVQSHGCGAWLLHNIGETTHIFDTATGETRPVPVAPDAKSDGRGRLVWRARVDGPPVHHALMSAPWSDPAAARQLTDQVAQLPYTVGDGLVTWEEPQSPGYTLMVDDGESTALVSNPTQWVMHAVGGGAVVFLDQGCWHLWTRASGSRVVCAIPEAKLMPTEGWLYVALPGWPAKEEMAVYRLPI